MPVALRQAHRNRDRSSHNRERPQCREYSHRPPGGKQQRKAGLHRYNRQPDHDRCGQADSAPGAMAAVRVMDVAHRISPGPKRPAPASVYEVAKVDEQNRGHHRSRDGQNPSTFERWHEPGRITPLHCASIEARTSCPG